MIWRAELIKHRGESRIAIIPLENSYLAANFRLFPDAKWSQRKRIWHLPDNAANRNLYNIDDEIFDEEVFPHGASLHKFNFWLQSKRYSANTIKTYLEALRLFLYYFRAKEISEISNDDVVEFTNVRILNRNLSASYQNQFVNAIKLFFSVTAERMIVLDKIHRPRREKVLPNVLSKSEIKAILQAHSNIKHRAMLSLIYSCGLRRSELLSLQPNDIDSKRSIVFVRQAKGKKDRIVPLSPKILELLREYFRYFRPKKWLFEGAVPGNAYDERSLSSVLKSAVLKAGITKPVSLHWLRHSYATHLLESGTDLRYIQEILGHSSSRTTEIYTHVSTTGIQQVKSPYDDL